MTCFIKTIKRTTRHTIVTEQFWITQTVKCYTTHDGGQLKKNMFFWTLWTHKTPIEHRNNCHCQPWNSDIRIYPQLAVTISNVSDANCIAASNPRHLLINHRTNLWHPVSRCRDYYLLQHGVTQKRLPCYDVCVWGGGKWNDPHEPNRTGTNHNVTLSFIRHCKKGHKMHLEMHHLIRLFHQLYQHEKRILLCILLFFILLLCVNYTWGIL